MPAQTLVLIMAIGNPMSILQHHRRVLAVHCHGCPAVFAMGRASSWATGRAGPEFWVPNGLWAGPGLQAQNYLFYVMIIIIIMYFFLQMNIYKTGIGDKQLCFNRAPSPPLCRFLA